MKLPRKKPKQPSRVEDEITRLYGELNYYEPYQGKYARILEQIKVLQELDPSKKKERKPVDPAVWISSATSLVGIGIIVAYEHAHVLTSKAFGLLRKP